MASQFNLYTFEVTNGTLAIPTNTKSYAIIAISGSPTINGVSVPAPYTIEGGNASWQYSLENPINIGCTGGKAIVIYEL